MTPTKRHLPDMRMIWAGCNRLLGRSKMKMRQKSDLVSLFDLPRTMDEFTMDGGAEVLSSPP